MTASSSSTYLHEKGSPFPAILPNWQYCKLGTKKFLLFLLIFLHQLRYTITERHIRNGCFCDSLFFYVSYNQVALGNSAISTNLLFLVLGIIAQTLYRSMDQCSEEVLLWGFKLRKVVAIYKTNKLTCSRLFFTLLQTN